MFLNALLEYKEPQARVIVVSNDIAIDKENSMLPCDYPNTMFILKTPTNDKPLKNARRPTPCVKSMFAFHQQMI